MPFRPRSALIAFSIAAAALVPGCMRATASASTDGPAPMPQRAATPRLVVFITVDQFRGDYPSRFATEYRRGLKRLYEGGAWFSNAFQDHGITETAPGHASTMSGRFPRSTGITSNSIGVVDPQYKLLTGTETAASPFRFQGTTLTDWVAAKDRRSRAFSVSMKDRGAILPIGKSKQQVWWYSGNGSFTTSDYYRTSIPSWVSDFNERKLPQKYAGQAWTLSRADSSIYKEADAVQWENRNRPADNVFPHPFPTGACPRADSPCQYLRATPMMDSVVALFALEGLQQLNIGRGPQTDIMAVSFSATDYVGHTYGPDSREAHENMLRLDETLGWFIDSLYKLRDSSTIVFAMTGDHGVSPIPELARERGEATGDQGLRVTLRQQVADAKAGVQRMGGDPDWFMYDGELVGVDRRAMRAKKINADSVLDAFAAAARKVPGVARVDRMAEMRKADFNADPVARRWTHQIPETAPVDLTITLTKYSYWAGNITSTHGSPYDQDAWVPILFYGAGVKTGKYSTFARTVDIAPTLAAMLGVKPTEKLDGVVLTEAMVR